MRDIEELRAIAVSMGKTLDKLLYEMLSDVMEELDQYKNNWEELKKWVKENSWYYNTSDGCQWVDQFKILNKMKELEENK